MKKIRTVVQKKVELNILTCRSDFKKGMYVKFVNDEYPEYGQVILIGDSEFVVKWVLRPGDSYNYYREFTAYEFKELGEDGGYIVIKANRDDIIMEKL